MRIVGVHCERILEVVPQYPRAVRTRVGGVEVEQPDHPGVAELDDLGGLFKELSLMPDVVVVDFSRLVDISGVVVEVAGEGGEVGEDAGDEEFVVVVG